MPDLRTRLAALAITLMALSSVRPLLALDPSRAIAQYVHRSWTRADGLPQNSVSGIAQADDGYLWIATRDGLARFDGARFTTFNRLNTPALRTNVFNSIVKAPNGTLWMGTANGLVQYDHGTFFTFSTKDGLPSNYVGTVVPDSSGGAWVGTGLGLARVLPGHPIRIALVEGTPARVVVAAHLLDRKGRLWFTADNSKLYRLVNGKCESMTVSEGPANETISQMIEGPDGTIWLAGTTGLFQVKDDRIVLHKATPTSLLNVLIDSDGAIWAALDGSGLARLKGDDWEFFATKDGLPSDQAG
ncbi:MAG TPA: two-component regulator propeller domain-containing protein, partial [Vicinamibacterales bacterium]|nr:two-component regulator propeller domain-containing protein [Vicinamibacterales bacterium]